MHRCDKFATIHCAESSIIDIKLRSLLSCGAEESPCGAAASHLGGGPHLPPLLLISERDPERQDHSGIEIFVDCLHARRRNVGVDISDPDREPAKTRRGAERPVPIMPAGRK